MKQQPPLPENAASGSGSGATSSDGSEFVKIQEEEQQQQKLNKNNEELLNDDDDEEEEEDEEETPLSLKTNALIDLFDSMQEFFDEALPVVSNKNKKDDDDDEKNKNIMISMNQQQEEFPPLFSITYIDKNIYEAKDYIPFVCDIVDLYVQKIDLFRQFVVEAAVGNNNDNSADIYFGKNGTCYFELTGCDLGPENAIPVSQKLIPALARGCKPNGPHLTLRLDNNRLLKNGFDALSTAILSSNNQIKTVLKDLSVRENSIRDDSMPQLCKVLHACPFLEDLTIGTSHIFPSGIDVLVKQGIETSPYVYKTLKTLNIEFNTLGNEGMISLAKALSKCYALEKLNVSDNSISDAGATAIAEYLLPAHCCGPLRWIDMSVNQIGEVGAKSIADALSSSSSSSRIEHLDIGCNPIGPEGGEALCEASKVAKRLITLDLTTTDLTEKAGRLLVEGMQLRSNVFKEAFIFECNNLSFEVRKKIAETMNSRRRLVVPQDDEQEFASGSNLKKFGEARKTEVDTKRKELATMMMNKTQNSNDEAINWPLIGCVLGVSGIAIWYLLKPKN